MCDLRWRIDELVWQAEQCHSVVVDIGCLDAASYVALTLKVMREDMERMSASDAVTFAEAVEVLSQRFFADNWRYARVTHT